MQESLSVREMTIPDMERVADYWVNASPEHLTGMGVDLHKVPSRESFVNMLTEQFHKPLQEKKSFCLVWLYNGEPVGHNNTNPTRFGEEAYMHLHLWRTELRKKGLGESFLKLSIPVFFERLELQNLFCEPYALNPAPNRAVEKLGFRLVREYTTVPGPINFKQPVKRWLLRREQFLKRNW